MSDWRTVEIYATFIKVTGQLEIVHPDRVSDTVNRFGEYLQLRDACAEPMSLNYPVLSRREPSATIAKGAVSIICPLGDEGDGNPVLWREKQVRAAVIHTQAFSLVGNIHLDARHSLQDHLERSSGDFLAVTNASAVWVTAIATATHALQRPFALVNPDAILSWSVQPAD